jgi:cytochrome c nitrite reductase small subunit
LGVLAGIIIVIFRISNATAYLSDDPKTCINCHVMFPQYETWLHSSHREKITCNDCHVPHDSIIRKYFFKAKDGLRHSTIFTLGTEPQVIRMLKDGQEVVQANCIRCHEQLFDDTNLIHGDYSAYVKGDAKLCWNCHRSIPHGQTRSLAATSYYQVPTLADPTPAFLESFRNFLEQLTLAEEK